MKLDHDCVRFLLLEIERLEFGKKLYLDRSKTEDFGIYPNATLYYTAEKLQEAGYIEANVTRSLGNTAIAINCITWEGHHFLDDIRDDGIWKDTKKTVSKFTEGASLAIVAQVATSIIKSKMGLS